MNLIDLPNIIVIGITPEGKASSRVAKTPTEAGELAERMARSGSFAEVCEAKPFRIHRIREGVS